MLNNEHTTQTTLVTGGTGGLGRHMAIHLAERWHTVLAAGRNHERIEAINQRQFPGLSALELDVTDPMSIERVTDQVDTLTAGRGLDVLVNNAGFGLLGPLELIGDADLKRQFDTNVFGAMAMTRAFVPQIRRRGRGRIINISSVGGRVTSTSSGG